MDWISISLAVVSLMISVPCLWHERNARRLIRSRSRLQGVPMAQPKFYRFEQRAGGRGAVIRIGEQGGQRLIAIYNDQATADEVRAFLEARKGRES